MAGSLFSFTEKVFLATGFISIGTESLTNPASNLVDNVMATVAAIPETTGAFAIDLGSSRAPDYIACFHHNITNGTVRIQGSDSAAFSSLIVDRAVTIVSLMNFWLDLRSISPRTARYWRVSITSNAASLRVGEIIAGTVISLRSFEWGYTDTFRFLQRNQGTTEWGVYIYTARGITTRSRSLKFFVPNSDRELLKTFLYNSGAPIYIRPSVFFPNDSDPTDVWMLETPRDMEEEQDLDNIQTITFEAKEQSPGE